MNKKNTFFLYLTIILAAIFVCADASNDSIGSNLADKLIEHNVNPYLSVFIIAMIPIVELRGAIPVGILALQLNWPLVVLLSILGNMVPIFFVLFIFKFVEKFLRRFAVFNRFFDWFFAKTLAKSQSVQRYQELGLAFFVGIPLPVTGAWTGSLIAYLLHLSYIKSILYIGLGVCCSACIVSVITYFKWIGLIVGVSILVLITVIGYIHAAGISRKSESENK